MLRGIPLKVPIEKAIKRRKTCDGSTARMINGIYGLNPGHPVCAPHFPHSLPDPVLDAHVLITNRWPEGDGAGRWFDPLLAPDDKEVYGFTNCMRKALDASLDCARRLDREREREREMSRPDFTRQFERSDQNVVPGATGGGSSSGLGTLPATPCSPETVPSKPRAVNNEDSRGTGLP